MDSKGLQDGNVTQADIPKMMDVLAENIPAELKAAPRWVVWRYKYVGARSKPWTKVPYTPDLSGERFVKASSTDPATWRSFDQTLAFYDKYNAGVSKDGVDGIGLMLGSEFAGVDLDKCRNPETGRVNEYAAKVVQDLKTYTEVSPSGTGLKALVRANLNGKGRRTARVEVYGKDRFFTITGHKLPNAPATVEDRQQAVDRIVAGILAANKAEAPDKPKAREGLCNPSTRWLPDDDSILFRAKSAKNGEEFTALWEGRWQQSGKYPSQSEADQALCSLLAFWCKGDPDTIDRLFRNSGLYRDKWDRQGYRESTLANAVGGRDCYRWEDEELAAGAACLDEIIEPPTPADLEALPQAPAGTWRPTQASRRRPPTITPLWRPRTGRRHPGSSGTPSKMSSVCPTRCGLSRTSFPRTATCASSGSPGRASRSWPLTSP